MNRDWYIERLERYADLRNEQRELIVALREVARELHALGAQASKLIDEMDERVDARDFDAFRHSIGDTISDLEAMPIELEEALTEELPRLLGSAWPRTVLRKAKQ